MIQTPVLVFTCILICGPLCTQTPAARALLIGLSLYAPDSGWESINGANDVEILKKTLLSQQFQENNVATLTNEAATGKNVRGQMKRLLDQTRPGDFILFHFSGHGQQIPDTDGDEKVDRLDESFVLYDAYRGKTGAYRGENHLTDDELGMWLDAVRKKAGANGYVLVLLDACHSGSGFRASGKTLTRGTQLVFGCETTDCSGSRPEPGASTPLSENEDAGDALISSQVVFTATSPLQNNQEYAVDGYYYGPLSYAFCKEFSRVKGVISGQALFERIRALMKAICPNQDPQASGNLERFVGGNKPWPGYGQRYAATYMGKNKVRMEGGQLTGIFSGTTLTFYPQDVAPGDTAGKSPAATGRVLRAGMLSSEVVTDKTLPPQKIYWAYPQKRSWSETLLKVQVKLDDPEWKKQLDRILSDAPFRKVAENGEIVISAADGGNVVLRKQDNTELLRFNGAWNRQNMERLEDKMLECAKAGFFRNISATGELDCKVQMELLPVGGWVRNDAFEKTRDVPLNEKRNERGEIVFYAPLPGSDKQPEYFQIRLENRTKYPPGNSFPLYFVILDILGDDRVNLLAIRQEDCQIKPGDNFLIGETYRITPPFGLETLALLVTKEPLPEEWLKGWGRSNRDNENLYFSNDILYTQTITFRVAPKDE